MILDEAGAGKFPRNPAQGMDPSLRFGIKKKSRTTFP